MDSQDIPSKYEYWARSAFERAERLRGHSQAAIPKSYWGRTAEQLEQSSWRLLFLDAYYKGGDK